LCLHYFTRCQPLRFGISRPASLSFFLRLSCPPLSVLGPFCKLVFWLGLTTAFFRFPYSVSRLVIARFLIGPHTCSLTLFVFRFFPVPSLSTLHFISECSCPLILFPLYRVVVLLSLRGTFPGDGLTTFFFFLFQLFFLDPFG